MNLSVSTVTERSAISAFGATGAALSFATAGAAAFSEPPKTGAALISGALLGITSDFAESWETCFSVFAFACAARAAACASAFALLTAIHQITMTAIRMEPMSVFLFIFYP